MIDIHCMAHRLELALLDVQESVTIFFFIFFIFFENYAFCHLLKYDIISKLKNIQIKYSCLIPPFSASNE